MYCFTPASMTNFPKTISNTYWIVTACYIVIAIMLPKVTHYLLVEKKYYILPVVSFIFILAVLFIVLSRIDYSRSVLFVGYIASFISFYASALIRRRADCLKLYAINNFETEKLASHRRINLTVLEKPYSLNNINGALVVDLHRNLSAEDEKFIADCTINNIGVFHSARVFEMIRGKVQTRHLAENATGTLAPNPFYMTFKRVWESSLIILSFPITLPIMAITALCIRLESPGNIMFIQERVGQGGKCFSIYKFRSMTVKAADAEDKFATQEQARVTRVGKIIRKFRIDELPQFFNVLKGDMALIGPRPEQESFVKDFEEQIPFYGYRHMVKPGITGWAQVVQGYADDVDSTSEKVSYDLYYIKYLSIWLDINIVFKTIRTMLTGFGAK